MTYALLYLGLLAVGVTAVYYVLRNSPDEPASEEERTASAQGGPKRQMR